MPATEIACRVELKALGAAFSEADPVSDPAGCRIDYPVTVTSLGAGVALEPPALVNCAVATAAARFLREVVGPAAKLHFGKDVETVRQVSGYVCRPRNGSEKLSEHAYGNALDIAAFELAGGTVVRVEGTVDRSRREFLRTVRTAACGPFKTVLGPGSDADHANHFHFDLAKRRNGGTFCQ